MLKDRRFLKILGQILKVIGIAIVAILLLFGILTWIVYEKKNEWLLNSLETYVNDSQSGQLKIGSADLKLLMNFPNITVRLNDIEYFEHRDSLKPLTEKPILHTENLFVAFELIPLFSDELNVVEIDLANSRLNIFEYPDGKLNITHALSKPVKRKPVPVQKEHGKSAPAKQLPDKAKPNKITNPQTPYLINLEHIHITNLSVSWNKPGNSQPILVSINELEARFSNVNKLLVSELNCSVRLSDFISGDTTLVSDELMCGFNTTFNTVTNELIIPDGRINYLNNTLHFYGMYNHSKNQKLDIKFKTDLSNLNLLSLIINPEVIKQNNDLFKQGSIYINGKIFGELKTQHPQFDVSFGIIDLNLQLPENLGGFSNIGFDGRFFSGLADDYSEAFMEIKNLRGNIPGGYIKGQLAVSNFKNPNLDYNLTSRLKINGFDKIFRLNNIKNTAGSVFLHAKFNGPLRLLKEHKMDNRRSSVIALNNLSFELTKLNKHVSGLTSKVETRRNRTTIQELTFKYGNDDFRLNASVDNLFHYFFFRDTLLKVSGHLRSDQLFTKDFILDTASIADVQDRISNLNFEFNISVAKTNQKEVSALNKIQFDIRNLSMNMDKLPDIKHLNANGWFETDTSGVKLNLKEFHAIMPHGKLNLTGDIYMPEKRQMQINAHLKLDRFPWTYVKELSAEISSIKEPTAKNLPVSKMETVTAELDLSASLVTYPFDIGKLDVKKGNIHFYLPETDSFSTDIRNLSFEKILFIHPDSSGSITGIKYMKGAMDLKNFKVPELYNAEMSIHVEGENDLIDMSFTRRTEVFEKQKGRIVMDWSKKEPSYKIDYAVQDANLETFMEKMNKKKLLSGKIDFSVHFNANGLTWKKISQSLSGDFEISGNEIMLYGIDIDDAFEKYQKSQNFNLADLGAVVVAGPLGLVVTKGSDFVSLANIKLDSTKQTNIKSLYMNWDLNNGQIISKDLAFTTKVNRIAYKGIIDFKNDTVPALTLAFVDKVGCSLLEQTLSGKLGALKPGKVKIAKTLFGSVTNSMNAVAGKDCTPFYTGRIKNP